MILKRFNLPHKHYIFFVLFSLYCKLCVVQEYYELELLNTDLGLSQNVVNCVLQDANGFIWLGTQDGLNRYDGYQFEYYYNNPADTNSLSNNYILSICEDEKGCLWIGTMTGGLNCFNNKTGKFKRYQINNDKNDISGNTIWCIASDQKGKIYAGTENGLSVFDQKQEMFYNYSMRLGDNENFPFYAVYSVFIDQLGNIWIGGESGVACKKFKSNSFQFISEIYEQLEIDRGIVWSISMDQNNKLLLGTNFGLISYEPKKRETKLLSFPSLEQSTVWTSFTSSFGDIFMGTRAGIIGYNSVNDQLFTLINDEINVEENNVWSIFRDNTGLIWAGCDLGIIRIKEKNQWFNTISSDQEEPFNLPEFGVNAVMMDSKSRLWIGLEGGGLNCVDFNGNSSKVYRCESDNLQGICGNKVWSLLEDDQHLIWIGTYGNGLCVLDPLTEKIIAHYSSIRDNQISNNRVLSLLQDDNSDIWIGTRGGGLNQFDKETQTFNIYRKNSERVSTVSSNTILSLLEDKSGILWIGTFEGGLDQMDLKTNTFTNFQNSPDDINSLTNNNIYSMQRDRQGFLWLGTQGGLNYIVDPLQAMEFHALTTKEGLPSNVILGIEEDNKGNLWLSTYKGLAKLNMAKFRQLLESGDIFQYVENPMDPLFTVYTKENGLISNEFSQSAHFKSADGLIFFGGPGGVSYFNPDSIKTSACNADIRITDFKIYNRPVKVKEVLTLEDKSVEINKENEEYYINQEISYYDEITLSHKENFFSFDFALLDFGNPQDNTYTYYLEGFDIDWNYIGKKNSVSFTNLYPGSYTLRIKAANHKGAWSEKEASLKIHITPPFYKTRWFIISAILFLLILIITIVSLIIRNHNRKALKEKEKIELQLKTIKNQMDPHFAFNAINMIGSMIYEESPDATYDYFSKFAGFIRTTLNDSEKISRSLSEELNFIKDYVQIQQKRFNNKFDFFIEVDEQIDLDMEIPKMILQVHIENSIKHGIIHKKGRGEIYLKIKKQTQNRTEINIIDNGIGRKKSRELKTSGTQRGMEIIRQIFELYNKIFNVEIQQEIIDLSDTEGKSAGTQIKIIIEK